MPIYDGFNAKEVEAFQKRFEITENSESLSKDTNLDFSEECAGKSPEEVTRIVSRNLAKLGLGGICS